MIWIPTTPKALRFLVALTLTALAATAAAAGPGANDTGPFPENPLMPIGGGPFVFGSDDGESNEAPARPIDLAPFAITKYEISNRLYRAFVEETGHRPSFHAVHEVLGVPDHPVVGVSWDDADTFCRHYGLRLPSPRQWERAARGPDARRFAWGNEDPTPAHVNRGADDCCGPDASDGFSSTAPVGSFPLGETPEGVADLTGNVWEWVDGWFNPYDAAPAARRTEFRVLRGGAWNSDAWRLRTTYRLAFRGDFRFAANGGFRCVSS